MRTALRRLRATDRSVNAVNPATRLPNTCLERALRYRYVLNMPENGKTRDERGFEALESSSGGFVHLDRRPRPDEARDFDGDLLLPPSELIPPPDPDKISGFWAALTFHRRRTP